MEFRPFGPGIRGRETLLGGAVLIGTLCGCATTTDPVSVGSIGVVPSPERRIAKPVAFFHDRPFRETLHTIEPLRNQWYLPLKIGEASETALRAAYPKLFESTREVASSGAAASGPALALIEPKSVQLEYLEATRRGWGPFYSRITWRFTLTAPSGTPIANWRVQGFGRFDPSSEVGPRGEPQKYVEATRRAVEAAAAGLVRSFERVPELLRWARDLPPAGSDAAAAGQIVSASPKQGAVEVKVTGILSLTASRARLPELVAEKSGDPAAVASLTAVRLTLRNESERRLAVDPADVQWTASGKIAQPLPPQLVAGYVSGETFGMAGATGLPGLFVALATVASISDHKQRLEALNRAIGNEVLSDSTVPRQGTHSGVVYFAHTGEDGELVVPVMDLDDAVRYTLRFPVPKQPGESMPRDTDPAAPTGRRPAR